MKQKGDSMDDTPPVLLPCTICSRTFRPEVLERHTKICEKASQKKRRPFDSFKSRVSGTELEEFLGPATLPGQPVKRPEKSPVKKPVHSTPKWKETHETLIATLRAARGETDNNVNLNLNKHAGSEQCPSCGRYFGPRAFDRHVEFCKEKTSRIKTTPSKGSQAHERLEARIKYRAPLSLKPKLTTKEKYSPMLPRKADSSELCTPTKSTPVNFAVKTPKPVPMKASPSPNQNHFSRQSPTRTSQRQRSVSPTKKSGVNNCRISANKTDPVIRQTNTPKIKDHLKGNEDLRPKMTGKLTAQDKIRREKKDESYDPFKQAEQQMMALLSWPSTVDLKANKETSNPPSRPRLSPSRNLQTSPTSAFTKYPNKDGKTRKDINENLNRTKVEIEKEDDHGRTYTAADDWEQIFEKHFDLNKNDVSEKTTKSVKSALDGLLKKSPRKTDLSTFSSSAADKSKTDGSLITDMIYTSTPKSVNSDSVKKFRSPESKPKTPSTYRKITGDVYGRISPPDDFGDSLGKENLGNKSNRNSGISLSSLSFSSQVSDTTIADDEVSRNNLEIIGVATPRSGRRKFARSQSVFDERNKMLFAKTLDRNFSSSDENDLDQSLPNILKKNLERKNPPPTSSPFRFPRSQSVAEDRRKGDGDHSDEGDNVSSPETNKNRKAKMSGDSAYSSLNRKSPRPNILPLNQHNDDRLSSSGSENSLPPLNNDHSFKPKSLDFDSLSGKKNQPFKMSKFCHECGSKYPVPIAKFCCECGVRRLII